MDSIRNLVVCKICLAFTMGGIIAAEPKPDEEFIGPFPSWANVKTDFGAVGNGFADDTAALQKALDSFFTKSAVLYLPAGTYRITKGLLMTSHMHAAVIGEDPARTIIKWDGDNNGVMMLCNGVRYSKIGRITWDGSGKSVTAVAHLWDGHTPNAATGLEHADEVYKDVAIGLRAGMPHFMDAECMVNRCKFLRCSNSGLLINSFNALDWWLWNCEFVGCRLGATNQADGEYGGGHFHIYESLFRNSTEADIRTGHTSYFGIRNNTSIGSKAFFLAVRPAVGAGTWKPQETWSSQVVLQGNTILDPQDATPIRFASSSSLLLLDNLIRSRAGATGPVVEMNAPAQPAVVAVGNTVTSTAPYRTSGRVTDVDTRIVKAATINPPLTELPGMPPQTVRRVFEVPKNADRATVQGIIDEAAKMAGQRPVVHFARGGYDLDRTLEIPAHTDMQLVGDGQGSELRGTIQGGGTLLHVRGPSHATFRDLTVMAGPKTTAIHVDGIDQVGGRVFAEQLWASGNPCAILAYGMEQTKVELRYPTDGRRCTARRDHGRWVQRRMVRRGHQRQLANVRHSPWRHLAGARHLVRRKLSPVSSPHGPWELHHRRRQGGLHAAGRYRLAYDPGGRYPGKGNDHCHELHRGQLVGRTRSQSGNAGIGAVLFDESQARRGDEQPDRPGWRSG